MPPRKRPGQEPTPEPEPQPKPSNGRRGKKKAATKSGYLIYVQDEEGNLSPLGNEDERVKGFEGRTANDAVKAYLGDDPDAGDYDFVVVPVRNQTVVRVSIGSVKKVTLS